MQRNYIWVNLWEKKKKRKKRRYIASLARSEHFHQKGTCSRQKEIPHHFTADAFNDYFLSIAGTLVKSQDSPDSD